MKPILFNTDMVLAILEGRKTVTRRVVKPHFMPGETGWQVITEKHTGKYVRIEYLDEWENETRYMREPFRTGDILYVRETWAKREADRCNGVETGRCPFENCETALGPCFNEEYIYKATDSLPTYGGKWHPSIHMPKEAARLFLRVTDVRVDRLQDITPEQARAEGCDGRCNCPSSVAPGSLSCVEMDFSIEKFESVWDSTIKPADLPLYGWYANPWVWVVEFERVSKEAALKGGDV